MNLLRVSELDFRLGFLEVWGIKLAGNYTDDKQRMSKQLKNLLE